VIAAYTRGSAEAETAKERGEAEDKILKRRETRLVQVQQDVKRLVLPPAIDCEIIIQC
jgi:hypothetical protein